MVAIFSAPAKHPDRPPKRGRTEVLRTQPPQAAFSKYLVVHSTDEKPITDLSVFLIAKCIENIVGKDYNAKKMPSGDLLVEVMRKNQSENLLKQEKIANLTVTVTPHRTLNTVQGVISDKELLHETDDDLLEGLHDQGVVGVRRIIMRRDGAEIKTRHIILTFASSTLPETVKAAFLSCRVRAYIPNPRRCFKCQHYGHGTLACRGKLTCAKCGENDHSSDDCKNTIMKCPNCSGSHAAYSRSCPSFKKEKEIIQIKVTENISFPEARQKHKMFSAASYADAARRGLGRRLVSTATQCSLADVSLSLTPSEQPPAPASTAEALVVPPPAGLPSTAEHPATTSAEPVENVVTGAVGTGPASSSPAPLARTTPEGIESMNSGGPTRTPSLPAPQVPTKKPAATSGTNPRGGCRMDTMSVPPDLSDEDMDTSASQPAQQAQNERRGTFGRGKKPPHRTTGPKQDSLT